MRRWLLVGLGVALALILASWWNVTTRATDASRAHAAPLAVAPTHTATRVVQREAPAITPRERVTDDVDVCLTAPKSRTITDMHRVIYM